HLRFRVAQLLTDSTREPVGETVGLPFLVPADGACRFFRAPLEVLRSSVDLLLVHRGLLTLQNKEAPRCSNVGGAVLPRCLACKSNPDGASVGAAERVKGWKSLRRGSHALALGGHLGARVDRGLRRLSCRFGGHPRARHPG